LSGGERIILLWVILEIGGTGTLPEKLRAHLSNNLKGKLECWVRKLRGRDRARLHT